MTPLPSTVFSLEQFPITNANELFHSEFLKVPSVIAE